MGKHTDDEIEPVMFVPAFALGAEVYLFTDPFQLRRVVTGYYVGADNSIKYELTHVEYSDLFYEGEIRDYEDVQYRQKHENANS